VFGSWSSGETVLYASVVNVETDLVFFELFGPIEAGEYTFDFSVPAAGTQESWTVTVACASGDSA
jgi:hypothetical protein